MGGDVAVESTPGQGSRFTVTLPPRRGQRRRGRRPALATAPARPRPWARLPRLLVADDHPVNREVLLRQLETLGLEADVARDGAEALRLWQAGRHGIVLLDLHMPELDGFDLTRAIRQEEAAARPAPRGPGRGDGECAEGRGCPLLRRRHGWLPVQAGLAGCPGADPGPLAAGAGAGAPISGSGALFDPEALRGLFGADAARLGSILDSFGANAAAEVALLLNTVEAKRLAGTAHRLKGAAHLVGARLLAEQAARVEVLAGTGDTAAALAAAGEIGGLLAETLRAARGSLA